MTPRILPLLVPLVLLPFPGAIAQEEPSIVELTLVRHSPVGTPDRPLEVSLSAHYPTGGPLRDLTASLWIYHPATSRSAYHQGLADEPPTAPLLIAPYPLRGPLLEGETLEIPIRHDLEELAARGENALYPIKLQLESGGVSVAAVRSAFVFIQEKPLVPLNLSLTVVLDPEIRFSPEVVLLDGSLETAIGEGGSIESLVSALEAEPVRATLALSPLLLEWLDRMSEGYRVRQGDDERSVGADAPEAEAAARMLERIRSLARSAAIEVLALPYASPSVPSLVASGLEEDLRRQISEGRDVVQTLLGVTVSTQTFHPPRSELDRDSVAALAEGGIESLVLSAERVRPLVPPDSIYSPSATVRLDPTMDAIVPDAQVEAYLTPPPEASTLRAMHLLGEFAAHYFEQPSLLRGASLVLRGDSDGPFLRALLRAIRTTGPRSTWLRPVKASQLAQAVPPETRGRLRAPAAETFSPGFVEAVGETRDAIDQFESMAETPLDLPERLRTLLLAAEARRFALNEGEALGFIRMIRATLAEEFDKIDAPSGTSVTLTSQGGVIPVTLRSSAEYPVRLRITLRSSRLEFLQGASREVVLDGEALSLTFPVRAQATGRFPVQILVDTPGGRLISESEIVVRSTAYNLVALAVTVGAALFLALWWGRRFWRRTTS
ncbi:MAG TPA: DUF6049 family protein [Actinomycetota bacterium]